MTRRTAAIVSPHLVNEWLTALEQLKTTAFGVKVRRQILEKIREQLTRLATNPDTCDAYYARYIQVARDKAEEGVLEVDDYPAVSVTDEGAYVQCWLYVSHVVADVRLSKEVDVRLLPKCEECGVPCDRLPVDAGNRHVMMLKHIDLEGRWWDWERDLDHYPKVTSAPRRAAKSAEPPKTVGELKAFLANVPADTPLQLWMNECPSDNLSVRLDYVDVAPMVSNGDPPAFKLHLSVIDKDEADA